MKKLFAIIAILGSISLSSFAQSHSDRITFGVGLLYERGLDATLAWEHETKYHNAWEYFVNGYLKWDECESCGHVCPESFWKNYRTWGVGVAYKVVTTMGIYVSVPVQEATRINSWVASMLATNIIMHLGTDGFCIGKLNVT